MQSVVAVQTFKPAQATTREARAQLRDVSWTASDCAGCARRYGGLPDSIRGARSSDGPRPDPATPAIPDDESRDRPRAAQHGAARHDAGRATARQFPPSIVVA